MALLIPDHFYSCVSAIDLEALSALGIRALLVDLDNTLLPRDTSVIPAEALDFADRARRSGMSVCVVSNNWHARVHSAAAELGFDLVPRAVKPLPFAFLRALRIMRAGRSEAAVIGDQLFTDVLGGKLTGLTTVLVLPLSSTDLPHTLLLRRLEARVLAGRTPLA